MRTFPFACKFRQVTSFASLRTAPRALLAGGMLLLIGSMGAWAGAWAQEPGTRPEMVSKPTPAVTAPASAKAAAPGTPAAATPNGAAASNTAMASTDQPQTPPNLLDQPASPATVDQRSGKLMVKAHNSSLAQILHQVSTTTGMQLDGLSGDERVFGNFGPGDPRDVLISLLNGTSYNVLMVGDLANGAPRELLLTHKNGSAPSGPSAPAANPAAAQSEEDNGDAAEDVPAPEEGLRQADALEQQQQEQQEQQRINGGDNNAAPQSPRTPEQMLREIQQQQQQQMQQQQQENGQEPQ